MVFMKIERSQNGLEGACTQNGHIEDFNCSLDRAAQPQRGARERPVPTVRCHMWPALAATSLLGTGDLVRGFVTPSWRAHTSHRRWATGKPKLLERDVTDLWLQCRGTVTQKYLEGLVTEGCLETCRSLLAIFKCLALWFNCCTTDIDPEYIAHWVLDNYLSLKKSLNCFDLNLV